MSKFLQEAFFDIERMNPAKVPSKLEKQEQERSKKIGEVIALQTRNMVDGLPNNPTEILKLVCKQ